jgi:hypothetical protein
MNWLRNLFARTSPIRRARRPRSAIRPRLEGLEDRCVPTVWAVTNDSDNVNQVGSLRYDVAHAGNGDTIVIPAGDYIYLTHGELVLNHDVTIEAEMANGAPGTATIRGDNNVGIAQSRLFEIARNAHVTLRGLDLEHGNAIANNPQGDASMNGDGGAILNHGNLEVDSCWFTDDGYSWRGDDFHVKRGGAIYNDHGTLGITHTGFQENFAVNAGGAIYNNQGVLVITRSDLDQNFTFGNGGAIYDFAGQAVLVVDCQMWDNHANKLGGAFYTRDDGDVTVGSTIMGQNTAGLGGGAIFNYDTWLHLNSGTTLQDNAALYGGGIDNVGGGTFIDGCSLIHNRAKDGGGIYSAGGEVHITNSKLDDNFATAVGGAIYASYTDLTVSNSELSSNTSLQGAGAAIMHSHGTLEVTGCTLMHNTAGANGVIFVEDDVAKVTGSKLIDNHGGGIFRASSQGSLTVGTTTFQGNTVFNIWGSYTDLGGNMGI